MQVPTGRVAYEPNSLDPGGPRESPDHGFHTSNRPVTGSAVRVRSETFADHYSQARLFYRSITKPEQKHLGQALTFELSKVETEPIRRRMLGHLAVIDEGLAKQVREGLGFDGLVEKITPARQPIDLKISPALRLYGKYKDTLAGRKIGVLIGAGFDPKLKDALASAIAKEHGKVAIVAAKIQGELDATGTLHAADKALRGSPSVLFDAVVVLAGPEGEQAFAADPDAVAFLMDASRHCKAVGWSGIPMLFKEVGMREGPGLADMDGRSGVKEFVNAARAGRFWEREE